MFGTFNLKSGYNLTTFKAAFDACCEHLSEAGHLRSHRLWRRAYHEGYDAGFPDTGIVLEMCFHSHRASLDAWTYIENRSEPLKSLHMAMIKQVEETHFVLLREVRSDADRKGPE